MIKVYLRIEIHLGKHLFALQNASGSQISNNKGHRAQSNAYANRSENFVHSVSNDKGAGPSGHGAVFQLVSDYRRFFNERHNVHATGYQCVETSQRSKGDCDVKDHDRRPILPDGSFELLPF